jgi:hypothetical protein
MADRVSRSVEHQTIVGDSEITAAEAREGRRAVALVLVGAVAVLWVVCWFAPWVRLEAELAISAGRSPASAACTAVLLGLGLLSSAVAAFGIHVFRFGRSVAAAKRFPPPAPTVVRETRVLTGAAAETLGRVQACLGATLIVLAAILLALVAYGLVELSA